jgi:protein TonB
MMDEEEGPFEGTLIIKPDPVEDPPVEQIEKAEPQPAETKQYIPDTVIDINEVGQQLPPIPLPPPTPFVPDPVPPSTSSLGLDPVGVKPINSPAGWVTTNDYPAGDIRQEHEGVAGFRVVVGTDGRVKSCEITSSSGFAGLDRATCRNVERRARFDAAKDANGNKVVGTYSNKVLWQIPD